MLKRSFIAIACLVSLSAMSQDSTSLLNEVIVTANKYPNKSNLTGKVVTVITREQIDHSGGKDLSQIITEQTGISINGANSNPGKDKSVYLRGAKVDHTLIMLDGIPLYDPSGIGSNFDIRLLTIENIDRIEILKGGQSTLYGSDAVAGVINIISRKTNTTEPVISGSVSYGSKQTVKTGLSLDLPMGALDYHFNTAYLKSGGINEATDTSHVLAERDKDGYKQFNLQQSLTWRPISSVKLMGYARYASFDQQYDQGAFVDELDLTSKNINRQFGVKGEWNIKKTQLFFNYNFHRNEREYLDDSTLSRNGFATYSKGVYNGTEKFLEVYAVTPIKEYIKLTVGADYRNSFTEQRYYSESMWGIYDSKLGKDSLKQQQYSMFMALNLQLPEGLNIEAGGRWNHHSAYGNNIVYNINPSFIYEQQWKIFANLSTAYKTPSLYQLYSEYGNRGLKPEVGLSAEAGLQYFTPNQRSNIRIVYFKRNVKDVVYFYTDPITYASKYINQDRQKDHGFEIEGNFSLNQLGSLRIYYTHVNGKITTINNGTDTSYFNLYRRPKDAYGLTYENTLLKRWFCTVNIMGVGKRTDLSFDEMFNQVEQTLKSYWLLNASISYTLPKNKTNIFADLRNITNAAFTEVYGFNTLGFNMQAGLRFSIQ